MDNIYFFDKLPNYVQYFGSNIVGGVAESWVEAEISWVEVDGTGCRWVHELVIPRRKKVLIDLERVERINCGTCFLKAVP